MPNVARTRRGSLLAATLAGSVAAGALVGVFAATPSPAANLTAPTMVQPGTVSPDFADLAQRVSPAVVNVQVSGKTQAAEIPPEMRQFFRRFFGQEPHAQPRERVALGSGFVISADGYIVTNNHVVESADKVTVTLEGGDKYTAKVVGTDPKTDLALLKIDAGHPLPYVQFGDSSQVRVGQWVMAVGNPFGLDHTVTAGIVSARGRSIGEGPYDNFLQIDAPINKGNSGGPTFNLAGEVIGINTAIFSPSGGSVGIGFAIPSDQAKRIVAQLKDHGKVTRGWLGVSIQTVTPDIASGLGLPKVEGALVAQVTDKSPAGRAGIQTGDVIMSVNGEKIDKMRELPPLVAGLKIGSTAKVVLWRSGKESTVDVEIGQLPEDQEMASNDHGSGAQTRDLGLTLSPLDKSVRDHLGIDESVQGVVVTNVEGDSQAGRQGIQEGDIIIAVNQTKVRNPSDVRRAVREARDNKRTAVVMLILRDGQQHYIAVPLRES